MKFKIDENLPVDAAELFRQFGYDTATVPEEHLGGHTDTEIILHCQQEKRILVSLDLGFADIRTYPPTDYPGMIVLRLRSQAKSHVMKILNNIIGILDAEQIVNHLWIAEEMQIRIRG